MGKDQLTMGEGMDGGGPFMSFIYATLRLTDRAVLL